MKKIRLLLIDLDGTLVNSKADITAATNRVLTIQNHPPLSSSVIEGFVGSGMTDLLTKSLKASTGDEVNETLLQKSIVLFKEDYTKHCLDKTHLYPGVKKTLEHLAPSYPFCVLTNKPEIFSRKILEHLQILNLFRRLVCAGEGVAKKPDPQATLKLIKEFEVEADETILVGDSVIDVETARRAGIKMALVSYGFGKPEELKNLTVDFRLNDFSQLEKILP